VGILGKPPLPCDLIRLVLVELNAGTERLVPDDKDHHSLIDAHDQPSACLPIESGPARADPQTSDQQRHRDA
jgi:hypothetical protein